MIDILLRLYPHARANGLRPLLAALGLVVAQALMQTIAVFSLIPLVLDKVGADPAVSSAVFVTAVTDVIGFFAFLGLAVASGLAG